MQTPFLFPMLVFALASLSIGGVMMAVLYPRMTRPNAFRQRFDRVAASQASKKISEEGDGRDRQRVVEKTLRELEEKQRARKNGGSKPSLAGKIRQAGLTWNRSTYYVLSLVLGLVTYALAIILGAGLFSSAGFGLAGGLLLPHIYVGSKRRRRLERFTADFPDTVDIIVRGLKAGLPMADCLKVIATETQEPIRSEFTAITQDQALGIPIDEAVQQLRERIPLPEANFFTIVIAIQSRTGGSLAEALSNLSRMLRERKKLQGKIKAMSAEAKASAAIIGALPFLVVGALSLVSPSYIALLFNTTVGNIVLIGSAIWMGVGIFTMRKMINFDF